MQWIGDISLWAELSEDTISDEVGGMPIKIVDYRGLVRLKSLPVDRKI